MFVYSVFNDFMISVSEIHEDLLLAQICKSMYIMNQKKRGKAMASLGFTVKDDIICGKSSGCPSPEKDGTEQEKTCRIACVISWNEEAEIIVVTFRGPSKIREWLQDGFLTPTAVKEPDSKIKAHAGLISSLNDEDVNKILDCINTLLSAINNVSQIFFSGHSVGGSCALLARTLWVCNKEKFHMLHPLLKKVYRKVRVTTFGSPPLFSVLSGQDGEGSILRELQDETRNYINGADLVPRLFNTKAAQGWEALQQSDIVAAVGQAAADQLLLLNRGAAAASHSYLCIGDYRFLSKRSGEVCSIAHFGTNASRQLDMPVGVAVRTMVHDNDVSSYVEGLSRRSPLFTLEAALQRREIALCTLDRLRIDGVAVGVDQDIAVAAIQHAMRRHRGDWTVQYLGEWAMKSLTAGPSWTGEFLGDGAVWQGNREPMAQDMGRTAAQGAPPPQSPSPAQRVCPQTLEQSGSAHRKTAAHSDAPPSPWTEWPNESPRDTDAGPGSNSTPLLTPLSPPRAAATDEDAQDRACVASGEAATASGLWPRSWPNGQLAVDSDAATVCATDRRQVAALEGSARSSPSKAAASDTMRAAGSAKCGVQLEGEDAPDPNIQRQAALCPAEAGLPVAAKATASFTDIRAASSPVAVTPPGSSSSMALAAAANSAAAVECRSPQSRPPVSLTGNSLGNEPADGASRCCLCALCCGEVR